METPAVKHVLLRRMIRKRLALLLLAGAGALCGSAVFLALFYWTVWYFTFPDKQYAAGEPDLHLLFCLAAVAGSLFLYGLWGEYQHPATPGKRHSFAAPGKRFSGDNEDGCWQFVFFGFHLFYEGCWLLGRAFLLGITPLSTVTTLLKSLGSGGDMDEHELSRRTGIGLWRVSVLLVALNAVHPSRNEGLFALDAEWRKYL